MGKKKNNNLNVLGNVIWLILGGLVVSVGWLLVGIFFCITIIGIPLGRQCFKIAELSFSPFGKNVEINFQKHPIVNLLWLIFFGWEMVIGYIFAGIANCITIIGIPFGLQSFKLAVLALFPFGSKIN